MPKEQAVRVNLSTQAKDILATMHEEMPKAFYYFRKKYGGKQKYLKLEDQMLDKALEEKNDQFTDIDFWISKVGNRWMTYTQAEYFPKAIYANAFHYSFIYYETMASCGAFFPLYSPKQLKKGKVTDKTKVTGVILYTDHFFYQMSERTKIEYRSKELIKEFVSQRLEHAMIIDDETNEVIVKFKGGHGFGKRYTQNPQYIAIRTFLRDEELNAKQRRACEPVDTMYELVKDGMYMDDVALNTLVLQDYTSEEVAKEGIKKLEALKKLGMEKPMLLMMNLHLIYVRLLEDILNIEINMQQSAVIANLVSKRCVDFVKKWEPAVQNTDAYANRDQELRSDIVDICCKVAKDMKLKRVNRDTINERIDRIFVECMKASDNYQKEAK
jgi:hypothetical protein